MIIAAQEHTLIINAVLMMLVVIIPVLGLLFFFAWHYRAGNTKATYMPNWEHAKMDELVWWAIPFEIVLVLGALTYFSTKALDPHKPLPSTSSGQATLVIQVIALPWKWLFLYPAQGIATVNYLEIPTNTPVDFEITADAPMNSFWIPALGGQVYAMTGMVNPLYLIADKAGDYRGLSANYSGEGFSHMHFVAHAVAPAEFDAWAAQVRLASSTILDMGQYQGLEYPEVLDKRGYYGAVVPDLFHTILQKFNPYTAH